MHTTGKINKTQLIIALCIIVLIVVFGKLLSETNNKLTLYLITGVVLGYILSRSRYGFAGGIKRIYVTGEGSLTKVLLIMFAVTMVASAGIQWAAVAKDAVPQFRAASSDLVIPGSDSVQMLNISTILGGLFFGIGMMLAGGCASGTLSDLGEGEIRSAIALPFFALFAIPGHALRHVIADSEIGKIGAQVYLPDVFGFIGTIIVSFALLLVLYVITRKYEDFRKKEGFYQETVFEPNEQPLPEDKDFKLFSYNTYHKFFIERWSFLKGGMLLSIGFIFVLNTTGKNWGVTSAFTKLGVKIVNFFGIEITSPAFTSIVKDVNAGLLYDAGTLRNFGIVIGAALCMLLAGNFRFNFDFKFKDAVYYAIGGALMGFGSRLAGGCNLGALYSAISSFSLSGWGFLVALWLGGIVALKMFEGKVNIIPPNRYKQKTKAS
ncbi:YeeE/YedE family protein [Proteiniborus sp. MB09-C3]|uniref:YeeE/YedE family protein n=1 Tax=Proteiniborus sp. MB09-C3 TaxID=3050072 RepID=UPI0025563CE8|nr:YeeE/YedE family protein [Proteiniborus sp. MB09-C3]WIV12359.1 YeeE/YedE family protein [Proteiniborus sp. MB09-C3]